ncbi:gustatory and pheromone receptor 39a-like [Drosophila willistoni]|uniref:gustatory and pheromone receptor 39a-like n=1 Tax=Drosophila willistoni TaxID=7260 RepID=UPI001F086EC8|nr:gustatory and pheromone receptor 39a-like [Drosophila willistoni]
MNKLEISELCSFYRICRYLGIFCIHYNSQRERYRLRRSLICYLVHFALQTYLVSCMVILVIYWKWCFKSEKTTTGNHYDRLVLFLALCMQFVQNAWLIWLQGPHLRIVRQLELYRRKYLTHMRLSLPKRMLLIIAITNMLYLMNFLKSCVLEWFANASRLFVFSTLGFPLRCLITSFTMGTYLGLINIVYHVLQWNQSQMVVIVEQLSHPKRSCETILRLRCCLELYDRLVLLCNEEISLVYGFIAWLSVLFASLDVTGIIYLTMVIQTDKSLGEHLLFNIIWLSPTLMTCAAGLMSNRVAIQVR